ncbi:hypothetical protein Pdw03_5204 [Penicillium digitatum]|uniref:Uncharacterized protein n=1 Tax=Penicillium digitatum TaxID=36651 RepID=A0A7T7BPR6_PENDI|nr:hypothetical protein Pdw03_5204 [Penicillium digitatum]
MEGCATLFDFAQYEWTLGWTPASRFLVLRAHEPVWCDSPQLRGECSPPAGDPVLAIPQASSKEAQEHVIFDLGLQEGSHVR